LAAEAAPVRRKYILIILAAVLAAAIVLTVVITRRPPEEADVAGAIPEEQPIDISAVEPREIREIELISSQRLLRLSKQNDMWQVENPDPVELDLMAVEDLVYTFARLRAEKVIDREPENLSQFGLDPPQVIGKATLTDGNLIELRLGDLTPVRNTYYLMKEGDPTVYAVWANHGLNLLYSLDDLRNKTLPRISKQNIQYIRIARQGGPTIEMQQVDQILLDRYPFLQSRYVLSRPYQVLQPVSNQELPLFLNKVPPQLKISHFIDDRPVNLAPYGLDPHQVEVIIKDPDSALPLLVGRKIDASLVYARQGEGGSVFALEKSELKFLEVKPFELIEKFAFIVFIDYVDKVEIRYSGQSYSIDMIRQGEGANVSTSFRVDGNTIEEKTMRQFYQKLIGLMVEAEIPADPPTGENAELELIYTLNRGEPRIYRLQLIPYNQDFYALVTNDTAEFLISRQQVETIPREVQAFLQQI
jgi:hypothetical protein